MHKRDHPPKNRGLFFIVTQQQRIQKFRIWRQKSKSITLPWAIIFHLTYFYRNKGWEHAMGCL